MFSVIILNVIMLNVAILSVVMLSAVAPKIGVLNFLNVYFDELVFTYWLIPIKYKHSTWLSIVDSLLEKFKTFIVFIPGMSPSMIKTFDRDSKNNKRIKWNVPF
jgi:hypothetical protein